MKIYIASHKKFEIPNNQLYTPLYVGGNEILCERGIHDNTLDNISELNNAYCELTALYWIWKNSDENIVGLVHYRRYFKIGNKILEKQDVENILKSHSIIVTKKRNYFITSIEKHYEKAHVKEDLELTRKIIIDLFPDYIDSYNKVMKGSSISLYNMFVTDSITLSNYCDWLFKIIDLVYERLDITKYDQYQKRVIGFLSERLFNVWIDKNIEPSKIKYLDVINTDGEDKFKKGLNLIKRHFLG